MDRRGAVSAGIRPEPPYESMMAQSLRKRADDEEDVGEEEDARFVDDDDVV